VRLAELSECSGVPVASIKFYLREGLLAPGAPVTARQAEYGEDHVRRLRLIRAMLKVGGMSVTQAKDVLAVADDPASDRHERLGIAAAMLPPHVAEPTEGNPAALARWRAVHDELRTLLVDELGWRLHDAAPALNTLTRAVIALRDLGYRCTLEYLRRYATALHPIADKEYLVIEEFAVPDEAIEATVAYTVLYEPIILALRRLAHEDVSARRYRTARLRSESVT
jgi:DNA-binding transcriptional MerR regulator